MFFYPYNGLDVLSKGKGTKNSSKFLYRDEVAATYDAGHCSPHPITPSPARSGVTLLLASRRA